jgi:hypothetical protein
MVSLKCWAASRHTRAAIAKSYTRAQSLLVLLLLTLASCEEAQSPTPTAISSEGALAFSSASRPTNPGHSAVFRFEDVLFFETDDPAQDLVVRHYNAADTDLCGGSSADPLWDFQQVLTEAAIVELAKSGTIPIYVYRFSEVPPFFEATPEICAALKDQWIYRGTHHIVYHDNNLEGDPTHTNAFGFQAEGTLFDPEGGRHAYRESLQVVADPRTGRVIHESYVLSIK